VYGFVGIAALAVNGGGAWRPPREVGRLALAAVLLLEVPEALSRWAQLHISGALGTAVSALVPVIVVLVVAQRSSGEGSEGLRLLVPALVGWGGVLLLIPVALPGSAAGRASLVVLVLSAALVAFASVGIHRLLQGFGLAQALGIVCLANALVLLGAAFFEPTAMRRVEWASAVVMAGSVVLLVGLLPGMDPVRLGARYLLVPLLTIVEGYCLLRPELTFRMGLGAGLLAGGAGWLLLSRRKDEVASLSLR
jgi:drug/metabolite transporter (DMT)-like permease